ncbi:MAG: DUF1707 domain-containing protein [Aeromicrobium erythreum]
MSDTSDPSGASRGDRRRARRMVDEAYAEGRITAADRTLRLEQIDAASTKGDLAMVLRDLESRPPTSTAPDLGAPPFGMPPPVADLDPVAPWDLPTPAAPSPSPPAAAPPAASTSPVPAGGGPTWAPPSYGGSGSAAAAGPQPGGWTTERKIGCGVIAVIAIFLVPLIVAVVVFVGVAGSIDDGFHSGSSDDVGFADDGYTEKDGVTVPDAATWWDLQVADLVDDAGRAKVTTYDVRDGGGTATVVDGTTARQWVFGGVEWEPVGEPTRLDPATSPVDLADVAPSVVQDVVETTLLEVGPEASPDVQLHVVTSGAEPRLVVDVTDGSTTTRGTFGLDGTRLD